MDRRMRVKAKAHPADVSYQRGLRLVAHNTPTPQPDAHRGFRGIAVGVLLGAVLWAVIIAGWAAAYRWLGY
jgi:hypothetical protein